VCLVSGENWFSNLGANVSEIAAAYENRVV